MDLWQLWQEGLYLWVNFEDLALESCSTLILAPKSLRYWLGPVGLNI